MTILNITITGDARVIEGLGRLPSAINQALYAKILSLALKMERNVKVGKLNGQVLNRITGALSRSIQHEVLRSENRVLGKVFSSGDVKYAAIHEYGGTTAPHIIVPKKASVLAFVGSSGGMVFTKKVNHPGSKMPERSFLRSTLTDMSTEISLGMKEAVVQAVRREIG
jgi:phage gpG-like protein